jgi:mannose-1-phosphate guanylyltransferase
MTHDPDLVAVVVAGGWGSRFWPLSTPTRPKQLVPLEDGRSMLRATLDRLADVVPPARTLLLTGADYRDQVLAEAPELPPANVVGEPISRDSAAAAALAVRVVAQRWPRAALAFLPSDHRIEPAEAFAATLLKAAARARETGACYLFGVRPDHPATRYGYLECVEPPAEGGTEEVALASFTEKPDAARAEAFLAGGKHMWNSGIFVWAVGAAEAAMQEHMPAHAAAFASVSLDSAGAPDAAQLAAALEDLPRISVDYALLEKAPDLRCLPVDFSWRDLGDFSSLEALLEPDADGLRVRGHVPTVESRDCTVYCEDPAETVALLGVEGLVVVRAGGRTLVAHRDRLAELKALVEEELRDQ